MKVLENKSIFKKLIIVFLCILLLSLFVPNVVKAKNDDVGIGGKLLDPVMSMFVGLGDGAITLLQKIVLHTDGSIIEINSSTSGIAKILGVIVAVTIVVVGVIAVVASGGTALSIAGGVLTVLKGGLIAGVVTYCVSGYVSNAVLPEDFVLPQIKLSPYEIFANQIPVFDVDFFNPSESTYVDNTETYTVEGSEVQQELHEYIKEKLEDEYGYKADSVTKKTVEEKENGEWFKTNTTVETWDFNGKTYAYQYKESGNWKCTRYDSNTEGDNYEYLRYEINSGGYGATITWDSNMNGLAWTDASIDITVKTEDHTYTEGEVEEIKSIASELQGTISNWYRILRDMSLVALLSILVYVGIRIIISSTSNDKAKYKQMLVDWIVAICLLFVMHYIMAFSNLIVKKIIDVIDATDVVENAEELPENTKEGQIIEGGVVIDAGVQLFEISKENSQEKQVDKAYEVLVEERANILQTSKEETEFYGNFVMNGDDPQILYWPTNNFTEQARMMLQFVDEDEGASNYAYASIGYKLIYCVLVIYTIIFAFTYFKRTVYMAFLTLIAPLVALTYPIDKMNDGQAQAFNKWFKEYIFNLLIQPLHLILYMVLIGSAMDFASQNIIYVVIALGFMTQGEKLLRSFFGFEKAHTPGFLAGPAGAAMMMNGVNKLLGRSPRKGGKGSKELGGSSAREDDNKINYKDSLDTSDLFDTEEGNDRLDVSRVFNNDERNEDGRNDDLGPVNNRLLFNNQNDSTLGTPDYRQQNEEYYNGNYMRRFGGNFGENIRQRQVGNNNDRNTSRFQRRTLRGLKNVGSKIRMKADNEHTIRKLAGVGTGLLGAGAAATAAGIIGITSGDVSKAAQYMGAGAIGGYKLTNEMPQGLNDLNNSRKEYTEAFKEGYYTDAEYQEKQIQNKIKEAKKDEELRRELERRLGDEDAKMALDTVSADCIRYGLGNANEIAATYQRVQSGESIKDACRQVKFVNEYGKDTSKLGHKDSEDLNATIMDRVRKNSRRGTSEREMQEHARKLRENFDATSKIVFKKL